MRNKCIKHLLLTVSNGMVLPMSAETKLNSPTRFRPLHYLFILTISLVPVYTFASTESAEEDSILTYRQLYHQLRDLAADSMLCAPVSDVTLQRDVASFEMSEGALYLLGSVNSRTVAAVYDGKGTFTFDPPTDVEKDQLFRFHGARMLEEPFEYLVLFFTDSTQDELGRQCQFTECRSQPEIRKHYSSCLDYISDDRIRYFDVDLVRILLNNLPLPFFRAHIGGVGGDPFFFEINPFSDEKISLSRRATPEFMLDTTPEVVCSFHPKAAGDEGGGLSAERKKDPITLRHYDINATIAKSLRFSASAEIQFEINDSTERWLPFTLYHNLDVDSAFCGNGEAIPFFKAKDNSILWIQLPSTPGSSGTSSLTFFYHGGLIGLHELGWHYNRAAHHWYPRYGVDQQATYNLTYHTPKGLDLVSTGRRDFIKTQDKTTVISQWEITKPFYYATFTVGNYKDYSIQDPRIPKVTVYRAGTGMGSGRQMQKDVAVDIANSVAFYQNVYGPAPFEELAAIEIPYMHGEAFPGLVQLSWVTFQFSETQGFNEMFRAHEVAHQWWGIGIDFQTYHDQWLSEGFAEFSGLWYMQLILKDNDLYFQMLDQWREAILTNRKYLFADGQESGPIWLGYRTSSSTTEGDYDLIIYEKGAWVLHMLRAMMIDLNTMNEDMFTNMMRDFYTTYQGSSACTEDFQEIVEKHMQTDMDWFFKQWIYGTDIPEYHFSWNTRPVAGDRHLFGCRIEQSGVPDDFRAHIPISLDFGNQQHARFRVWVEGPVTEHQLMLPEEPKKAVFNYLESVLCSIRK